MKHWHPHTEIPEDGRKVWVLCCHKPEQYPEGYAIHSGEVIVGAVEFGYGVRVRYQVENNDGMGSGSENFIPASDCGSYDDFIAWAYADELNQLPDWIES